MNDMLNKTKLNKILIYFFVCLIFFYLLYFFYLHLSRKEQRYELKVQEYKIEEETKNNAVKKMVFENKEKCFIYKNQLLSEHKYEMMDVFYSIKLNTCILSYYDYRVSEDDTHYNVSQVIKDLFTGEVIFDETNALAWERKVNELRD